MAESKREFPVVRAPEDPGDLPFDLAPRARAATKKDGVVDLWPTDWGQKPWNQGIPPGAQLACTAYAVGAAAYWVERSKGRCPGTPSFAFIFNNESFLTSLMIRTFRAIDRHETPPTMDGFHVRAACRAAATFGVPYLADESAYKQQKYVFHPGPPFEEFARGRKHLYTFYNLFPQVQIDPNFPLDRAPPVSGKTRVEKVKRALLLQSPVVMGFEQLQGAPPDAKGNYAPLPKPIGPANGGHAVLIVGYDDNTQRFRFRNSWGTKWGDGGYGTLPYDWVHSAVATYCFWAVGARDETIREKVMFRGLNIRNRRKTAVNVIASAYDGGRRFLGSCHHVVEAGERLKVHPVRWMDTYRLEITAQEPSAKLAAPVGTQLIVNCPNGSSATRARIDVSADPAAPPTGTLLEASGKPLPIHVVSGPPPLRGVQGS